MRSTTRWAVAGVLAVAIGGATAAPGAAAGPDVYSGVYDGVTTYTPRTPGDPACDTTPKAVTGHWTIKVTGDRAVASTNLFYDVAGPGADAGQGGDHHLAWGGRALDVFEVLPTPAGAELAIRSDIFGSGNSVTMTVYTNGTMTYVVQPYNLYGNDCASLTLTGKVLVEN